MRKCRAGFTLIEMLLALVLTSFLTAALSVMIGQAARDRHALQQQTHDPAWSISLVDTIERDLRHARWWAGSEERLVLIGVGLDGIPAQIEYRWVSSVSTTAWTRKEAPLTEGVSRSSTDERVLAIGLRGLAVGPYRFGEPENTDVSSSAPLAAPRAGSNPVLLIDGAPVTLQVPADRITIELVLNEVELPRAKREVVLH